MCSPETLHVRFPSEKTLRPGLQRAESLPSKHAVLGHQRPASKTPLEWRFTGGPMMSHLRCLLESKHVFVSDNVTASLKMETKKIYMYTK